MPRNDDLHELRAALTRLRADRGLTQRELALLMGRATASAVGKLEGGETDDYSVTLRTLSRWVDALDAHVRLDIINGVITVTFVGDARDDADGRESEEVAA